MSAAFLRHTVEINRGRCEMCPFHCFPVRTFGTNLECSPIMLSGWKEMNETPWRGTLYIYCNGFLLPKATSIRPNINVNWNLTLYLSYNTDIFRQILHCLPTCTEITCTGLGWLSFYPILTNCSFQPSNSKSALSLCWVFYPCISSANGNCCWCVQLCAVNNPVWTNL